MYQGNCVGCGRKVRTDANWLKAHLWGNAAVFDWSCFTTLMKEHNKAAAENAPLKQTAEAFLKSTVRDWK
jgi:predicted Fe-S protein YdhL (DUF1289 family)